MLTLTARVLGTSCCVLLLLVLCRMEKLIGGVKQVFSSGPSSQGSGPHSGDGSQDSTRSSCLHRMRPGGRSAILHTMVFVWPRTPTTFPSVAPRKWKSMSLTARESLVTHVYDVNLFERVEMDEELPLILRTIGWGKLYVGDQMNRATDGWLCNRANGNASIHRLIDQHNAWPLRSLLD
jgi:hypothetical protein